MNKISNDFVTIEYDSETGRKTAEYYMELFNKEPEYFKGILNGRNTIHASHIPLPITNDEISRGNIIKYILETGNAKCTLFCGYKPSMQGIYYSIMTYYYGEPCDADIKLLYHQLAYDYLEMTGDFSYLKKYYYDNYSNLDILELCKNKVDKCYDELLIEKINDTKNAQLYPQIRDNMGKILEIIKYNNNLSSRALIEEKTVKIPKIGKKKLEELVIGALVYIDPTNKLVEEYLQLKREGNVEFIYGVKNKNSEYSETIDYTNNHITSHIKLYVQGNLVDARDLVHELGHYFYRKEDKTVIKNNSLLSEYPSIYFEHKALEYLETVGYTEKQIAAVKKVRMIDNKKNLNDILPSLYCIQSNMYDSKYHLEEVKEYVEDYWKTNYKNEIESASPSARKRLIKNVLFINRIKSLSRIDEDESNLKYLIGTYLTRISLENLQHENVLEIQEYIQHNKVDLDKIISLVTNGGNVPTISQNEIHKVKQKQVQ